MKLPSAPLDLTLRQQLLQFGHVLQSSLFPRLEEELGELSPFAQLLVEALALVPLERWLPRNAQGRPRKKRTALAAAFLAKSIYGFGHTRQLIEQLKTNPQLRRCCGWRHPSQVPHESCFSRAFAEFARTNLAQQLHATLVQKTQGARLIGHISRDSTAIAVRERLSEKTKKAQAQKAQRKTRRKARKRGASERGTLIERQRRMSLKQMLATLPAGCDGAVKMSSKGQPDYWRGYKLHLDVADGQIPISAILTSASVHDVNVAIPLMTMTSERVTWFKRTGRLAPVVRGSHLLRPDGLRLRCQCHSGSRAAAPSCADRRPASAPRRTLSLATTEAGATTETGTRTRPGRTHPLPRTNRGRTRLCAAQG